MELRQEVEVSERRRGVFLASTSAFASAMAVAVVFLLVSGSMLALLSHFGNLQHQRIAEERLRGLAAAAVLLVDVEAGRILTIDFD
jgi:signal transduction histidine kinase